jgi:hypothetical protein
MYPRKNRGTQGEKISLARCPQKMLRVLARDRSRVFAVRGRRLNPDPGHGPGRPVNIVMQCVALYREVKLSNVLCSCIVVWERAYSKRTVVVVTVSTVQSTPHTDGFSK